MKKSEETIVRTTHEIWVDEEYGEEKYSGKKWVPQEEYEKLQAKINIASTALEHIPEDLSHDWKEFALKTVKYALKVLGERKLPLDTSYGKTGNEEKP